MLRITLVLTLLLAAFPASAYMTIGTLKELEKTEPNNPYHKSYILGLHRGIIYTDAVMNQAFGKRLFCLPENMNYESLDYPKMTLAEAKRMGVGDDTNAEMVLVFALMTNFPCD